MPTRPLTLDRKLHGNRRRHGPSSHADALYGLLYPPNHLRLVGVSGDPADGTRALMTFDRPLGPLPGDVNLWCDDRKGFLCAIPPDPTALVNPRVVRVAFNAPVAPGSAWSFDPSLGDFTGADGCAYALAAAGLLADTPGPLPGGKIFLCAITRYDASNLDFAFSAPVTTTGDASGFWSTDESGNPQSGIAVASVDGMILRVSFAGNVAPAPAPAGMVAGFSGIVESADLLSPVTWRV